MRRHLRRQDDVVTAGKKCAARTRLRRGCAAPLEKLRREDGATRWSMRFHIHLYQIHLLRIAIRDVHTRRKLRRNQANEAAAGSKLKDRLASAHSAAVCCQHPREVI